jgi:hypothetical protein
MRLVLVMLARNEADVIAPALRWHLANGVDHAIVLDHDSTDATPDILSDLARNGRVTHLRRSGLYAQAEMTAELVRLAAEKHGADWVIPCDADEFWSFSDGSLKDAIADIGHDVIRVRTLNFIPTKLDDLNETDPVLRMRHKVARPPHVPKIPYLLKPTMDKVMFAVRGFRSIEMGNHSVVLERQTTAHDARMSISHYPLRSQEQFFAKVIHGGAALEANKSLSQLSGYHWRRWYKLYRLGRLEQEWGRQNLGRLRLGLLRTLGVIERDDAMAERYRTSTLEPERSTVRAKAASG